MNEIVKYIISGTIGVFICVLAGYKIGLKNSHQADRSKIEAQEKKIDSVMSIIKRQNNFVDSILAAKDSIIIIRDSKHSELDTALTLIDILSKIEVTEQDQNKALEWVRSQQH